MNAHGGTGLPDYGRYARRGPALHRRGAVLLAAPVRAPAAVGRVRALPEAEVRDDRDGLRVGPADAHRLDDILANVATTGPSASCVSPRIRSCGSRPPTTSSRTARSARASPARPTPRCARMMGDDRFMWGSDYPHDEGTYPFTIERTCVSCSTTRRPTSSSHARWQRGQALRLRPRQARAHRRHRSARPSPSSPSPSPSSPPSPTPHSSRRSRPSRREQAPTRRVLTSPCRM